MHGTTLAQARNAALAQVTTEYVVHLDADDQIAAGYLEALLAGTADLRAPSVRYVRGARARTAVMPRVAGHHHACTGECLPEGNWLVVGALARADLLRAVGGWEEWPLYEDWALWLRCWKAGATVEAIPAAVYVAEARPGSRNRAPDIAYKNRVHAEIVESVLGGQVAA